VGKISDDIPEHERHLALISGDWLGPALGVHNDFN